MKKFLYTFFLLSLVMLMSCSEDDVTVDVQDASSHFMPAADDQSEEAQLRRTFYEETGSFLLFNDTLQHYVTGTDVNGDVHYFTEVLDLNYEVGMSTIPNEQFTYTLLTDLDGKRVAVQYLKDYLLSHLSDKMLPYSWLLVDKIQRNFTGTLSSPYAAAGQRAVVVACNLLPRLTDAQKEQYATQVMNTIIGKLATDQAAVFTEFLSVSAANYEGTFTDPQNTAANTAILNEAGFITRGKDEIGNESNGLYPDQQQDIAAFARLVVATPMETLKSRYAAYPLVVTKCEIMLKTLKSLGYVE